MTVASPFSGLLPGAPLFFGLCVFLLCRRPAFVRHAGFSISGSERGSSTQRWCAPKSSCPDPADCTPLGSAEKEEVHATRSAVMWAGVQGQGTSKDKMLPKPAAVLEVSVLNLFFFPITGQVWENGIGIVIMIEDLSMAQRTGSFPNVTINLRGLSQVRPHFKGVSGMDAWVLV